MTVVREKTKVNYLDEYSCMSVCFICIECFDFLENEHQLLLVLLLLRLRHYYCCWYEGHLQSIICGRPGNLVSWAFPGHHRYIYSMQWMQYRNRRQGMVSSLQPTNAKIYILLHPDLGLRDPLKSRLATLFCQRRSQRSSLGCGGTRTSFSRSTSMYWRHSARRLSTSSEWLLIWSGEETETHFWCCTGPLFAPSLTMVASCMAQHRIPIYGNWTASIIQDWDWPCELSAPAQSPVCTKRPTKLILRNVG